MCFQAANAIVYPPDTDRIQITSSDDKEARKVGLVQYNQDQFYGYCTATNISDKYILIAAHCLININDAKLNKNLVYLPSFVGVGVPSPKPIRVREGYILKEFITALGNGILGDKNNTRFLPYEYRLNDMALLKITINEDGVEQGLLSDWYSIGHVTEEFVQGKVYDVSLSSYPADKKLGTLWIEKNCKLSHQNDFIGKTSCDTFERASGAALIQNDNGDPNGGVILGVFTTENFKTNINSVAMLSSKIANEIHQIISGNENKARLFKKVVFETD